ncbi:putative ribonuclease H-like domain-containing protein [Tanacetum coccineum]
MYTTLVILLRECPSKGTNDGKKRDSFYQDQGAGKKEQNQNCLLTMDDGVVNWGEHTVEEEETNHALMAINSNNELGEQEAKILAYTLAVKKLEAQIVTFQKQQLSLNEQLTFQANEIYAKDEKLKRYRRIGMKAVKEKEQLKKTVDSWKDSSKNLWKLIDSGMSSTSKVGLGKWDLQKPEVRARDVKLLCDSLPVQSNGQVAKPVWTNANRVNHANQFVPRTVQLNDGRPNINSIRPNNCTPVPTRTYKTTDMTSNNLSPKRPQVNHFNQRRHFSKSYSPVRRPIDRNTAKMSYFNAIKGNWGTVVKTSAGSFHSMNMEDRGIFDSGMLRAHVLGWMFDIDYLTDSMNYIPVSLDNQSNPHAGTSEVTNSAGTLQSPNANASEEADEDDELIVVPTAIKHSAAKVRPRKSSTNSKEEKFLTELQNLQTQEKEAFSTGILEDTPKILAFKGKEPKKIFEALKDDNWVEAMQEELLQFRLQHVWILVDLPHGAKAPRAWYATFSTFLEEHGYRRGTIDKTLFIKKDKKDIMLVQVYVDDIIFGSTRKSWCDEFEALMKGRFQMSSMGELIFFLGLQVKQKTDGLFISQDKYVADLLKKFDLASLKTAITPMETKMALTKDEEADDVDVTPKTSHLNAVKRIFKYLKGKPNLGLWYPRESPFDLEAYSDSDYAGANLDRKSTTGGCQFLGRRLISWQCKKQTIVATSTTEAEYVAAASCYGQVLWIQNQMLDYGFNFMNTKIHIDNESTICIVKNLVYHSKTKHIEIRHHFIRDSYEKKLIRVEKIHTDFNVADLLTKAFDGPRLYLDYMKDWSMTEVV